MADTFHLQITTPERQLVDEAVTRAEIPAKDGYLGILPEHAPLLSELGAGVLSYSSGAHDTLLAVIGGFLEVLNNEVRVLAEHAEFAKDVNLEQARQELSEAQTAVDSPTPNTDTHKALSRLQAAQARVEAAERAH
ncbi:MAG: ATP synthase F1 subunit epsilon [Bryobacteraceae bacterium]